MCQFGATMHDIIFDFAKAFVKKLLTSKFRTFA
jgi:hypothetical protein